MQDLKVTLVQADQVWEDKTANFDNYLTLLEGVKTDLIVLPEMFNTGFSMNVQKLGEDWKNSESLHWLINLSEEKQAAIYTSMIIQDGNNFFNRGVFIFPTGEVKYYDKRKSFALAGEDKFFTPGNKEVIVEYKDWKIQLQICYDIRFPEVVRNRLTTDNQAAYDLILYVANWPEKRINHWDALLMARAIENQCYVLGVNRVGIDNNQLSYCGHSKLIDPNGKVYMSNDLPVASNYSLSSSFLQSLRSKLPFLTHL